MTPFEQALQAEIAAMGGTLDQIGPEHIAKLLQVQTDNQVEHDVMEALKEYAGRVAQTNLNNEQRSWYGLPLLPRPPIPGILSTFAAKLVSDKPTTDPHELFYMGIVEGIRRFLAGADQSMAMQTIVAEAKANNVPATARNSPWGMI